MAFHWLRDKEAQHQFNITWGKGKENNADYFTKHHSAIHHRRMQHIYVKDDFNNMFYNIYQLKKEKV